MSGSPISASEAMAGTIDLLWQASLVRQVDDRRSTLQALPPIHGTDIQTSVVRSVALHLLALVHLDNGVLQAADITAGEAITAWTAVEQAIAAAEPELAARAHAFHARLAHRSGTAYGALARKQLLEYAGAARLKTEALRAAVASTAGDRSVASEALARTSSAWRGALPLRLPGLRQIELAAARWSREAGRTDLARVMNAQAGMLTGVHAAYPEDAPERWPANPRQDQALRFAFAATPLPEAIQAAARQEEQGVT